MSKTPPRRNDSGRDSAPRRETDRDSAPRKETGRDSAPRNETGRDGAPRRETDRAGPERSKTRPRGGAPERPATKRASAPRGQPAPDRPRVPLATIRIDQVQKVLGELLQWAGPADVTLSRWMRAHPGLGARDRAEVAEAVYDVLRNLRRYRRLGESGTGPASRRLAILGLAATWASDAHGAAALDEGLEEAEREWLAHVARLDLATLPRAVRCSLPDWLEERLGALPDADALIESLNRPAPLDIRVNPLKAERDDILRSFRGTPAERYAPAAMPWSPWGIRMQGRPPVNRWPQFEDGRIEVQDEGSQLLALLVAPRRGEMIIDFCAGAGGKSLLIGALMRSTGRLYAFDVSAARLARAKPRFARSGLSNIVPVVIQDENDARVKRLAGKVQRVLVDAPCSGIGTLRRNPDLKWRQHPAALVELTVLQARILASAARCVAPGGRLVYATCSLLSEENEAHADAFLTAHPEFERVDAAAILNGRCPGLELAGPYVNLRPDRHGADGFFAAVFERRKGEAPAKTAVAAEQVVEAAEDVDAGQIASPVEPPAEETQVPEVPAVRDGADTDVEAE
jgi:16S rRNA (cytosine967-C5)-methyltransferase